MENIDQKIKKSLKYSILDGTFYSAMVGFGESFFTAFAVFLKANDIQLGFLGSLPRVLGSLSQLYSNKLLEIFKSRKKFICLSVMLQGLMYIPIALVFFLGTYRVIHLIVFVCLYYILGMILGPSWNSWMGDLVEEKERGTYFGKRNKITGFTAFITFMAAGYLLQMFSDGIERQYQGFAMIFALALLSRMVSFIYLTKKYEPEYDQRGYDGPGFIEFIRQAQSNNYGLLVFYLCFMNLAVYLAVPFFTPYMLYTIHLDYMTYTLVNAAALVVKFIAMPIWGELLDRYGTKKVLVISGFLMPLVPLLWVFSPKVWYLMLIQLYGGFIWAGFDISSFNFIFDTTTSRQRATYIAYYNVLNGIAILFGGILGGVIMMMNRLFAADYCHLFILSFLLRYIVSIYFIPKLKEVRAVEEISYSKLIFKFFTTMPTRGLVYSIITIRKKTKTIDTGAADT